MKRTRIATTLLPGTAVSACGQGVLSRPAANDARMVLTSIHKRPWCSRGQRVMPAASAVRDIANPVHVVRVNADPDRPVTLDATHAKMAPGSVRLRGLAAPALQNRKDFAAPNAMAPQPLGCAQVPGGTRDAALPARALVAPGLR